MSSSILVKMLKSIIEKFVKEPGLLKKHLNFKTLQQNLYPFQIRPDLAKDRTGNFSAFKTDVIASTQDQLVLTSIMLSPIQIYNNLSQLLEKERQREYGLV